jgi:hypothetical protein
MYLAPHNVDNTCKNLEMTRLNQHISITNFGHINYTHRQEGWLVQFGIETRSWTHCEFAWTQPWLEVLWKALVFIQYHLHVFMKLHGTLNTLF